MRYVIFRWTPTIRGEERTARALAASLGEGWRTLIDWRGVLFLVREDELDVVELPHGRGAVLGEIYSGSEADASIEEDSERSVASFAQQRWGSYIAVVIDRGHDVVRVLRSPDGAYPCFVTERDRVHIVFSEARDLVAMTPDVEPDLAFLAAFLTYPRVVLRRTALSGVEEVAPGEALVFTRTSSRIEPYWTPCSRTLVAGFEEGVRALRVSAETVASVVSQQDGQILHRLSGGFDSTAVLGLLTRTSAVERITCINEYWSDAPEGDERDIARLVAGQHGVRLIELGMDPSRVHYERTLSAPFGVKPTLSVLSFADAETQAAYAGVGASVLTSGRGGDHIFHRSRTAMIAADAVRDGRSDLMSIAVDAARLTRRSVWGVFQAMIAQGVLRMPIPQQPRSAAASLLQPTFANPDLADHPWIAGARTSPPARAMRIGHLRDALSYHDISASMGRMRAWPLLLSQPIVDACLRIAPYTMTHGGMDRSLARAAFADLIPPMVHARTQKGETTRYFAAVLASNRDWIADALVCGELANSGLVEPGKLESLARTDWRQDGLAADGLYSLIAVEVWLRALKACKRASAAQCESAAA